MGAPKKLTQYMREQIENLTADELLQLINKANFTPEQRKELLLRLGEIEADPQTTPKEMKAVEEAKEKIEDTNRAGREKETGQAASAPGQAAGSTGGGSGGTGKIKEAKKKSGGIPIFSPFM